MASAFEPDLSGTPVSGLFHGHMNSVVATDPHGRTPTTIISMTDDWHLVVDWEMHGFLIQAGLLSGTWRVQAFLESIGPGPEIEVANGMEDIATGGMVVPLGRKYSKSFIIPPGTPDKPGAYLLTTIVTCEGVSGIPGPFAGYFESPTLMFYRGANLPQ